MLGHWYPKLDNEYPTSTRLYLRDINAASLNAKTFEQLFPTVSLIDYRNIKGLENIVLSSDQMTHPWPWVAKGLLTKIRKCQSESMWGYSHSVSSKMAASFEKSNKCGY
jgi:hypothetical protein